MSDNSMGFLITMAAFAFFVVCPRMGAMTNLLERHTSFPIYWLVIMGTFVSIPLLLIMTWLIKQWGLMAGLGFTCQIILSAFAGHCLTQALHFRHPESSIIWISFLPGPLPCTPIGHTCIQMPQFTQADVSFAIVPRCTPPAL